MQSIESYPDELFCLICLSLARDPQQVNCCGKILCKTCLQEHKKNSNMCPQCRRNITSFADKLSEQRILSLTVKYDNSGKGCDCIGEMRLLDHHLTTCNYTLLPCPNMCLHGNDIFELLRKDIADHEKECPKQQHEFDECPYCLESGEYWKRTSVHVALCPKVIIPCPNEGCDEVIEHCTLSQHQQECLFEEVPCSYSTIGCNEVVLRKNLENHENEVLSHLKLAINTVSRQEATIKKLKEDMEQMQCAQYKFKTMTDKKAHQKTTQMKFKIEKFNQLRMSSASVYSPAFYTSLGGYKMCFRVDTNGCGEGKNSHISVFAHLMRGKNDSHLPWPFTGTASIELLNQIEDNQHRHLRLTFNPHSEGCARVVNEERATLGYGFQFFIPHSDLDYDK